MKIRQDFVTNSSSTSFIISLKDEFTEENFLEALGVKGNPLVKAIFHHMFYAICNNMSAVSDDQTSTPEALDDLFYELNLDWKDREIIEKLLDDNRELYSGSFDDTSSGMEYFLCQEKIKISGDNIFFYTPERY
ncbi:MAG: hypothetical protein LBP22_04375 [Deltaproteobacteria bacterium]|jgi:hypothetical protein|nr:hypothetical protein [Deltaproteobacteria bacterium]